MTHIHSTAAQSAGRPRVVDPHIHLWDRQLVGYPWLNDAAVAYSGDNRLLPRRYGVAELLEDAASIDLKMSIHVEANPANPLAEVRWLQSLADDPINRGHPHGIVAHVDLSADQAPESLDELSAFPNLRGIRQILNVHPDPRYDYVGRHFMREPSWRHNLRRLEQFGWSFDLQLYPAQIEDAVQVIDANPNTTFIVNHAGMFVDRDAPSGWRRWREGLRQIAARDNTAIKLSGFVMFDHDWRIEGLRPYVLETIDAFGAERCMFASNFPIDGLHAAYGQLWAAYAQIIAGASRQDRDALFADNAIRYYRLADAPHQALE